MHVCHRKAGEFFIVAKAAGLQYVGSWPMLLPIVVSFYLIMTVRHISPLNLVSKRNEVVFHQHTIASLAPSVMCFEAMLCPAAH